LTMVRDIQTLYVLCLRSIGPPACDPEKVFEQQQQQQQQPKSTSKKKKRKAATPTPTTTTLSSASKLLRLFHRRKIVASGENDSVHQVEASEDTTDSLLLMPPLSRIPCTKHKRANANEVDLNHPFLAMATDGCSQHGNPALDCLQTYIDSLVALSRLDDRRLGVHFFKEWAENVSGRQQQQDNEAAAAPLPSTKKGKKRKRELIAEQQKVQVARLSPTMVSLGSISFHNGMIGPKTIDGMVKSGMGPYVGVLDLTGVNSITDDLIHQLLKECPNIHRLSLKNCRKLTNRSLESISTYLPQLTCLDIGGTYNMRADAVLHTVNQLPLLTELYASGLQHWNDVTITQLVELRPTQWKGLGIGFCFATAAGLRHALGQTTNLERLNLAFCETSVDSGFLGFLGRSLPSLTVLDIRGNQAVTSLTGFYDGRTHVGGGNSDATTASSLFILARYSGLSNSSIEETKRIYPLQTSELTVVMDSGGSGGGIRRK